MTPVVKKGKYPTKRLSNKRYLVWFRGAFWPVKRSIKRGTEGILTLMCLGSRVNKPLRFTVQSLIVPQLKREDAITHLYHCLAAQYSPFDRVQFADNGGN